MRSIWTGSIGFGLVSIPIKLFSAVQETRLDLDMLDSRDHANIKFMRVNEHTKKEVPYDKIVKGYKYNDDYVIIEDADFEAASPEKSKVIEIENFVDLDSVNPMYYESSYYTQPATKKNKAYALLLEALKKSGKAGLARFVLRSTESLCIVHPVEQNIVITRIRFAQQIRDQKELSLDEDITVSKKELDMGLALINQYAEPLDLSKYKDQYHDELMKIIEAKAKGKRPTIKKLKPKPSKSNDLYDQLLNSLQSKKGA
ncbi:Ku protein [Mucilaginibacter rubeus]|uniref:Non-homologous end joining protein Ku n=1 Tax=Mucilaginibacter rubeus TaxID=2027860 RepID=A0A5C1I2E4_9SPHI|nr:Ku protein [Mucilaginibacter rubeus]QEM12402.1 Ku protein [Mucilaginibacter rubeus]